MTASERQICTTAKSLRTKNDSQQHPLQRILRGATEHAKIELNERAVEHAAPGRNPRAWQHIKKGDRDLRGNEAPVSRIFEARGSRLQRDVCVRTSLTQLPIFGSEH